MTFVPRVSLSATGKKFARPRNSSTRMRDGGEGAWCPSE